MDKRGIKINDKHTFSDYGLYMLSYNLPMPEVKRNRISVPYASGDIDLTDVYGLLSYEERKNVKFSFASLLTDYKEFWKVVEKLAADIHGKSLKVVLDDDNNYFYMMRLSVDHTKTNPNTGKITLTGTASPFKYDLMFVGSDWIWDTFNFITGKIVTLNNIRITADIKTIDVPKCGLPVVPEFVVSETNGLKLVYNGREYDMSEANTYRFPSVKVADEEKTLTFEGTGVLSVRFRGGYL